MIFDPTIFYNAYLDDYHKLKAITLKSILDDLDKYDKAFFGERLTDEGRETYKKTLQADFRQTYFHAIETFFELFFALNPLNKDFMGDKNIMIALTHSNWRDSYKKINDIATNEKALDFLDEEISMHNIKVSVGHYIFYYGISDKQKLDATFSEKLHASLEAIKQGIRFIARDFVDREEYNCYKHGLRIIPALKELSVVDLNTKEKHITWNLENSMSFFLRTNMDDEVKVVTKLFDPERDYQMTYFCSNAISNMVYHRKIAFEKNKDPKALMAIQFFGKEEVTACEKVNVEIQDLIFSAKRIKE